MRFSFFLGEALGSMRRNWVMAMAAIITVFISTGILGGALVTRDNLNRGATSLENRVLIEVFLKDSVNSDPAQLQQMVQKINGITIDGQRAVKSYQYISKAQALKIFSQRFGETIVSNLVTNPLPASYQIQVKDPSQVDAVAAQFFNDPMVDNTPGTHDGVKYAAATVRRMLGTINLIGWGMWIATGIFAAAAVLLISTTVRLSIFARRREVEIMRLVGATNWFIRWPFVLEGFVTGLVGAVLAAVCVWLANWGLANWVKNSQINFLDVRVFRVWWEGGTWPLGLLPTLAILGTVLGALGSIVALRRYLRT